MSRDPQSEELTSLISGLLDGRLSATDHGRLESLLAADPRARRLYMQMIDQEIELPCLVASAQSGAAAQREGSGPKPVEGLVPARPLRHRWVFATAAALGLLLLLALFVPWRSTDRPVVGSLQRISPLPPVIDTWSENFESGVSGLWYGQLITNNLPSGSKYGMAPLLRRYPVGQPAYVVQLPDDWNQGLFALTTGSTLHVTYRLANRGQVNVFMHTIPAKSGRTDYEMYQLAGTPFLGGIGQWQTIAIPFSEFIRKVVVEPSGTRSFVGGPPQAGELVTTLVFSSLEPIDFVIDQIWITPREETNTPRP